MPKFITAGRVVVWSLAVGLVVILIVLRFRAGSWSNFWEIEAAKALLALLIVVVVTGFLHLLLRLFGPEGNRGLLGLIVGQDGRVSTSKLQMVLWTYTIFFALLLLLFYPDGLATITNKSLQAEYLVLLGSPAAAAVLAKTFTTTKVQNGTIAKPEAPEDSGLLDGLTDVVSDDEKRTDLFDFQYFVFNVVALSYFFWTFLPQPQNGLPPLPETIVALTGLAAAGYATKKGLESNVPVLTGVYPPAAAPGEQVLVRGKNLTVRSDTGEAGGPNQIRVLFGGKHEQTVQLDDVPPTATDEIRVSVPTDAEPGQPAPITVMRADNIATEELPFDVVAGGPRITNVRPSLIVIGQDDEIIIDGIGFVKEDGPGSQKNAIMLHGKELSVRNKHWTAEQVRAIAPENRDDAERRGLTVPSTAELVVYDHEGRKSRPGTRVELVESPV